MTATLRVMNLTKSFGSLIAVDNISFSATQGEVVGFLGPNGAGKSTTMKMITGFLTPSAGTAYIDGYDIMEQPLEAKKIFGYLPEGAPSYPDMSVINFLRFIAEIRGIAAAKRQSAIDNVVQQVNLSSVLTQRIENLSKGYKRRLGLAQAIIHNPDVLILDEPTDGLDPNQKREVRNLITTLAHNKVIVMSTHILEEVEAVCNRVIIVAAGKVLLDSTPDDLINQTAQQNTKSALEQVFFNIANEQKVIY